MKLNRYVAIQKAFLLMLADNVASSTIFNESKHRVLHVEMPPEAFQVEEELAKLTIDELYEVCCGAPDSNVCPKISAEAQTVLNFLFEEI